MLNGEPFTRYCLRSIYRYAHQILVVEGGSPYSERWCTPDGHSIDGTLEVLRKFKEEEDPENKVEIVTTDGFWAEKDEQSRAYVERATGDWIWQIDIDEFYLPGAMERTLELLGQRPEISGASFPTMTFWGDIDYWTPALSEGSGFRRLFKFEKGYTYASHRPPSILNHSGQDLLTLNPMTNFQMSRQGIYLYHYALLFPLQVERKCGYYQALSRGRGEAESVDRTQPNYSSKASDWAEHCYMGLEKPFRVHNTILHPSWLERFIGSHPPEISRMMSDIANGEFPLARRGTDDIEALLADFSFQKKRWLMRKIAPLYTRGLIAKRTRPWWLRRDLFTRLKR